MDDVLLHIWMVRDSVMTQCDSDLYAALSPLPNSRDMLSVKCNLPIWRLTKTVLIWSWVTLCCPLTGAQQEILTVVNIQSRKNVGKLLGILIFPPTISPQCSVFFRKCFYLSATIEEPLCDWVLWSKGLYLLMALRHSSAHVPCSVSRPRWAGVTGETEQPWLGQLPAS